MGLFTKKADPINERSRQLNSQIAALEDEIKQLSERLGSAADGPRVRSTVTPGTLEKAPEPIFEDVDTKRIQAQVEAESSPAHYNELGVRKYDLSALFRRAKNHIEGPTVNNPKLINYLAAGSIQGLKPLRYERRVARNRFFAFAFLLLLVLIGLFGGLFKN